MKNSNVLGVEITKPNQILIIMRGIPGSGKSTKAKELIGLTGIIHSTDNVLSQVNDDLFKAHQLNIKNLINSLNKGISPVILDNTNLKHNEPKTAVKIALEMGLDDKNIQIVDLGTNGLTVKQLTQRNQHNVSQDKIERLVNRYKSQGEMTVSSILKSKDFRKPKILYTAVVLDDISRNSLLSLLEIHNHPKNWNIIAHHMTISYKQPLPIKEDLGKDVILRVTHLGVSDMAVAVKVNGYDSNNKIPHITLAVNLNGGEAVMSNDITNWNKIKEFFIKGKITEFYY